MQKLERSPIGIKCDSILDRVVKEYREAHRGVGAWVMLMQVISVQRGDDHEDDRRRDHLDRMRERPGLKLRGIECVLDARILEEVQLCPDPIASRVPRRVSTQRFLEIVGGNLTA